MVKYLGSKRVLVPALEEIASRLPVRSAADLFAGTTRVGQALRRSGLEVVSNDVASYSEVLGLSYVAAGPEVDRDRLRALLAELNALDGVDGYVTETFCRRSRFFMEHNGRRIDAIRDRIDTMDVTPVERALLLTSLLEAADRVDSTCGVQMAYVKAWASRARRPLWLREPAEVDGPAGVVTRSDANALAPTLDVDCVYLDPPYNQHSYFSNYHVWETLVRWDAPESYGVACKRVDCRTNKSPYNSKRQAWGALSSLVESIPSPWIVLSFSDEGFHDPAMLAALLQEKGHVAVAGVENRRYVGAQIGVFNPAGKRVGEVSHLRNRELLFVCGPSRARVRRALEGIGEAVPA